MFTTLVKERVAMSLSIFFFADLGDHFVEIQIINTCQDERAPSAKTLDSTVVLRLGQFV